MCCDNKGNFLHLHENTKHLHLQKITRTVENAITLTASLGIPKDETTRKNINITAVAVQDLTPEPEPMLLAEK